MASDGRSAVAAVALAVMLGSGAPVAAQVKPAIVANDALRVCGDPANLPFSDQDGRGFENKIAELVAAELNVPLQYYWMPQGPGFVRNTLGTKLCDVIIGFAAGAAPVLSSNAYYRSSFVLVVKKGGPLDGVTTLGDERLQGKRLGVVAATPPSDYLLRYGLMARAKPYRLVVDRRYESPAESMIADIVSDDIDGGLLWGPIGGFFAEAATVPLSVTQLLKEKDGPPMEFRIAFGVRLGELEWKRKLNEVITAKQPAIDRILLDYHVPLLDDDGKPITEPRP